MSGGKLLRLPASGRLLVSTDLQGNLRDFRTLAGLFEARRDAGEELHLLFVGDLVHGPTIPREHWPAHLGEYYQDASDDIVVELIALRARHPGRVHALLGNHEHAHVGGPPTSKFWEDEATHLEHRAGPVRTALLRDLFATFPLVALAPCGVVFTHGAPSAAPPTVEEIEAVEYTGHHDKWFDEIFAVPVLGPLLWSRWAEPVQARAFAAALGARICLFGHDVAVEGYEKIGDEQLLFSTSYGLLDGRKVYVELDLAARYGSVVEFEEGREIRPLYPDAAAALPPRPNTTR
jgi:hypothetical protein